MDTVIFEEFKGTGNAELKLDRRLADKRIFPAIDVDASGTRKEELLLAPEELRIVLQLRRVLHALDTGASLELLLDKMKATRTNVEFLMQIQKTTPERLTAVPPARGRRARGLPGRRPSSGRAAAGGGRVAACELQRGAQQHADSADDRRSSPADPRTACAGRPARRRQVLDELLRVGSGAAAGRGSASARRALRSRLCAGAAPHAVAGALGTRAERCGRRRSAALAGLPAGRRGRAAGRAAAAAGLAAAGTARRTAGRSATTPAQRRGRAAVLRGSDPTGACRAATARPRSRGGRAAGTARQGRRRAVDVARSGRRCCVAAAPRPPSGAADPRGLADAGSRPRRRLRPVALRTGAAPSAGTPGAQPSRARERGSAAAAPSGGARSPRGGGDSGRASSGPAMRRARHAADVDGRAERTRRAVGDEPGRPRAAARDVVEAAPAVAAARGSRPGPADRGVSADGPGDSSAATTSGRRGSACRRAAASSASPPSAGRPRSTGDAPGGRAPCARKAACSAAPVARSGRQRQGCRGPPLGAAASSAGPSSSRATAARARGTPPRRPGTASSRRPSATAGPAAEGRHGVSPRRRAALSGRRGSAAAAGRVGRPVRRSGTLVPDGTGSPRSCASSTVPAAPRPRGTTMKADIHPKYVETR